MSSTTCAASELAAGLQGAWTPAASTHVPYRLVPQQEVFTGHRRHVIARPGESVWDQMGLYDISRTPNRAPHNYGACAMRAAKENRTLMRYEYAPNGCVLATHCSRPPKLIIWVL